MQEKAGSNLTSYRSINYSKSTNGLILNTSGRKESNGKLFFGEELLKVNSQVYQKALMKAALYC